MAVQEAGVYLLQDDRTHVYTCGLRGIVEGVEMAMTGIAESYGQQRAALREAGRYHVETY